MDNKEYTKLFRVINYGLKSINGDVDINTLSEVLTKYLLKNGARVKINCQTCTYHEEFTAGQQYCNYIFRQDKPHSRGCPPGEDCIRLTPKKAGRPRRTKWSNVF